MFNLDAEPDLLIDFIEDRRFQWRLDNNVESEDEVEAYPNLKVMTIVVKVYHDSI